MTNGIILANYEELDEIAKRFARIAEETGQIVQRIRGAAESLENGGWEGGGAGAFYNEMNDEVFPALERLDTALQESGQAAHQVAQIFRDAEEETRDGSAESRASATRGGEANAAAAAPITGARGATRATDATASAPRTDVSGNGDQRAPSDPELQKKLQNAEFIQSAQRFNGKKGYSVDTVRRLEKIFGLPHSLESENGEFSKELSAEIVRYQASKGLKDVDGKLGEDTLAALRKDYPDQLVDRLKGPGEVGRQIISANATEAERYDYYKNVVEKNYGVWRSGPGEMNLVGIRGMADGKQVTNKVGRSDDTVALVWTDSEGKRHVKEFKGSVDPGIVRKEMNKRGVAHLKDGSYVYMLGKHKHGKSELTEELRKQTSRLGMDDRSFSVSESGHYAALRQKRPVTVYRDTDKKGQQGRGYIEAHEMVEDRGMHGINMHYSGKQNPWSQGCQVIAGAKEYHDFIGTIQNSTNTDDLPYTVIDASKL